MREQGREEREEELDEDQARLTRPISASIPFDSGS